MGGRNNTVAVLSGRKIARFRSVRFAYWNIMKQSLGGGRVVRLASQ